MNESKVDCNTCKGSGWNPGIGEKPIDITAPVRSRRGLDAIIDYVRQRLCCPDCNGSGKQHSDH